MTSGTSCELTNGGWCVSDGEGMYGNSESCFVEAAVNLHATAIYWDVERYYDYIQIGTCVNDCVVSNGFQSTYSPIGNGVCDDVGVSGSEAPPLCQHGHDCSDCGERACKCHRKCDCKIPSLKPDATGNDQLACVCDRMLCNCQRSCDCTQQPAQEAAT